VCMSEKSQDLRYFLSIKCRCLIYAAEPYRCVVDLPFREKRGFKATTYRPRSLKVLMSYTWEGTAVRHMHFQETHFLHNLVMHRKTVNVVSTYSSSRQ
jgi:hypothetical protein